MPPGVPQVKSGSHSVVSNSLGLHGLYTVCGILQARILEWVAFPFSRGSSQPRSPTLRADSLPAEPQGKPSNTGVGSLSLLQQILPTQELNRGLLHCRWILYQLSYCLINIDCPNSQGCWENGGRQRRLLCRQTQCDQHVGSPAELRTEDPPERAGRHLGKGEPHMQGLVGGPAVSSSRSGEA